MMIMDGSDKDAGGGAGPYTEGGGQQGQLPLPKKLNLQFLF